MQITKVELKNIKNHAEAAFSFQPGVIAICGPNGSGKTTILEAIAWTLFDHLDYKRDDFVKRGTKKGQATVGFISNLDGREYIVSRDTGGGYYVYDPITKARLIEQKNQVVPWLQQHLGVEPGTDLSTLFKTMIGVPQGAFTYDFTLAPSNRKSVFDQILKVEEYRRASDNLRETLRQIENRLVEVDKKLAEAEGELKAYDETKREAGSVKGQLKSMSGELATANTERDRAGREVELLNQAQRKIEGQRGTIERLRVRLELKRGSLSSAREAAEQARAAAAIVEAAFQGHERYLVATGALAELEHRRVARDDLRSRLTSMERELIEARSRAIRSRERLDEIAEARLDLVQLNDKVEEQLAIERRINGLLEKRGELQSLQRSLAALDRELEKLSRRQAELSHQVGASESYREKAARAELLEEEKARLVDEIGRKELALNSYLLKTDHLESRRREHARLTAEFQEQRCEIARLEPLAAVPEKLAEQELEQQSQTERLARLRAEVARDQDMITALESGGICPLLTEKCLNLKPGESLDSRFRNGLVSRRDEIERLEQALDKIADELKRSRTATAEAARLPHLRKESARLARELEDQEQQIDRIDQELSPGAGAEEIQSLKDKRGQVESLLREAREAERVYGQIRILLRELEQAVNEDAAKRQYRHELAARVDGLTDIESQISEAESRLRALGDPRGRASALERIMEREEEWRLEAEKSQQKVAGIDDALKKLGEELQVFASLDAEIASVNQARAANESDYQAYIAHQKIAATAAARQSEVATLATEVEQTDRDLKLADQELRALESGYSAERHRRLQVEFDQWRERSTQLTAQLEHTQQQFDRLQSRLTHLDQVRERVREDLAKKAQTLKSRETADFIREILQKAAPYITESYLISISNEANQLFREITGRFDVTLRWTKDYEIMLEEEGRERPFLNLSGGEQMAAALSVRLALLKELSEINLAFFDEPTTNMDEERRRNLAQQIGRIKDFQQLFVISHDDSFEGYTDQIITLQ